MISTKKLRISTMKWIYTIFIKKSVYWERKIILKHNKNSSNFYKHMKKLFFTAPILNHRFLIDLFLILFLFELLGNALRSNLHFGKRKLFRILVQTKPHTKNHANMKFSGEMLFWYSYKKLVSKFLEKGIRSNVNL